MNRVGNLSFQPLPILCSKSSIKEPPNKLNIQRASNLCSIFVGNLILPFLVFALLVTPTRARVITLEEQPEEIQTLYHWRGLVALISALLSLISALLSFMGLIVGILAWHRSGPRRSGADGKADEEGRAAEEGRATEEGRAAEEAAAIEPGSSDQISRPQRVIRE